MLIILFFAIHIAIVAAVLKAYRQDQIFLNRPLAAILYALPIVGAVSVFLFNVEKQKRQELPEEGFEERFPWLADEVDLGKQRSAAITIDHHHIVPFQEALLINNMRIRRELIIDVIFEAPDQYVDLLHQARLNEDVEVVHYATTILSELSAKYDARLQQLKDDSQAQPENSQLSIAYLDFLHRYIQSGIAEGYHARSLKNDYIQNAEKLLAEKTVTGIDIYTNLANIYSELKEFDKLDTILTQMEKAFPEDEATWMTKLEAIILKKSGSELEAFLKTIKEKKIYFSRQNRQKLAFWQQDFN